MKKKEGRGEPKSVQLFNQVLQDCHIIEFQSKLSQQSCPQYDRRKLNSNFKK